MRGSAAGVLVLLAALTALAPQAFCASKKAPQTTDDGLELKKETKKKVEAKPRDKKKKRAGIDDLESFD